MQEPRTIQLIRSIDRLDLQARRRRVKGEGNMNLSLLSDTIEYRREMRLCHIAIIETPRFLRPPHQPLRSMYACTHVLHTHITQANLSLPIQHHAYHQTPRRSPHLDSAYCPPTRTQIDSELPIHLTDVTPPFCAIGATYKLSFKACSQNRVWTAALQRLPAF